MKVPIVEFPRVALRWPDRRLWAARVFALRATVLGFIEQYPWAVGAIAVPLTIIGLAGVAMLPLVFVPLLVLIGVALIAIEYYADQQRAVAHQAEDAVGARKWTMPTRIGYAGIRDRLNLPRSYAEALARLEAAKAKARADDARARATAAQVSADEAEKEAEFAQARVAQLRLEADARTERIPDVD